MKKTPQMKKLEEMLRSSKFSAGGFMGTDRRSLYEIIDSDAADIEKLGQTRENIADRMMQLSTRAETGMGSWVKADEYLRVRISDTRGQIPCPWAHGFKCSKAITTAERVNTNIAIQWSYMNIHLIKEHGFFEGKGATFRLEPKELVKIIFP